MDAETKALVDDFQGRLNNIGNEIGCVHSDLEKIAGTLATMGEALRVAHDSLSASVTEIPAKMTVETFKCIPEIMPIIFEMAETHLKNISKPTSVSDSRPDGKPISKKTKTETSKIEKVVDLHAKRSSR